MAVDWLNLNFSFDWLGASSTFVNTLQVVLIGIGLALLAWGLLYVLSFKNIVRVRQHTASGYVIIDTKAREFTTKDGAKKWRLLRLKWITQSFFAPSADFLEFTHKGKFSVEADRMLDGLLVWRKRSGKPDVSDSFTGEERTLLGMEMRRSEEYKKNSVWNQVLNLAPTMLTIIILVLLFANWADITNSSVKTLDKTNLALEKADQVIQRLDASIERQNRILEVTYGINPGRVNGTVDNKGQDLPIPPN